MTTIRVRVTPGAREDAVVGWQGDALKVTVKAAAERGRANKATCDLLACALGVPASSVVVHRGQSSREKLLLIEGLSEEDLRRRLPKT